MMYIWYVPKNYIAGPFNQTACSIPFLIFHNLFVFLSIFVQNLCAFFVHFEFVLCYSVLNSAHAGHQFVCVCVCVCVHVRVCVW